MYEYYDRANEHNEPHGDRDGLDPVSSEYPGAADVTADEPADGTAEIDDNFPPIDPPRAEGAADEPEPGQALRHIVEFIGNYLPLEVPEGSPQEALAAQAEQVISGPSEEARIESKAEANRTQVAVLREEHAPQLRAAGMEYYLRSGGDDPVINASITDPARFARALDGLGTEHLEDQAGYDRFNAVVGGAVMEAVRGAAGNIRQTNPDATVAAFGGDISDNVLGMAALAADIDTDHNPDAAAYASNMAANAGHIADRIEALHGSPLAVESSRIMAMAHAEGKLVDWAAGDAADLLNCSHLLAGMERLQSPQEWEPAYRYLEHLQQTGGDSDFVRVTRDTVLDDIIHSRETLTQATTPESLAQLDADEGLIILAEAAKTMPLLDTAYNRVREIFGV